jgi:4-diphosphocytidyl-2-C-methyl-D-erythritol kinase
MDTVRERAPAKVNLVLQVGPAGERGLHQVCSLFASIDLEDQVVVEPARRERHEVISDGVDGPNLCLAALESYEEVMGRSLPPLRVTVTKRIPVAAGMAGGSADAAATLRAADVVSGAPLGPERLREIAFGLGSDVPSQVEPRHALVMGEGELVEPVSLPEMALVLVPSSEGLSTAEVFAEADRIGSTAQVTDPDFLRRLAGAPLDKLADSMENDLEPAVLSLRPELSQTLAVLLAQGALAARVTGSGPTCFGVFRDRAEAESAAARVDASIPQSAGALPAIVAGLRQNPG